MRVVIDEHIYIEDKPENFAVLGSNLTLKCGHGELLRELERGGPVECDGLIYEVVIVDVVGMEQAGIDAELGADHYKGEKNV